MLLDEWLFCRLSVCQKLNRQQNSLGRNRMHEHLFIYLFIYLFECLGIQFFNSLTCDLRDTMPRQRSLTLLPREVEDFPRGDKHFKHMPPLTYLICLSPKELHTVGLFKPYDWSDSWRICSLRDSSSLNDKLSVLKVSCFIRLATELYS